MEKTLALNVEKNLVSQDLVCVKGVNASSGGIRPLDLKRIFSEEKSEPASYLKFQHWESSVVPLCCICIFKVYLFIHQRESGCFKPGFSCFGGALPSALCEKSKLWLARRELTVPDLMVLLGGFKTEVNNQPW